MNFREYLRLTEENTVGTHNDGPGGAYMSTDVSGSEASGTRDMQGHSLHMPGIDIGLPSTNKTAKITFINKNKNPIHILLGDGTKLYFNLDQYKRISGPEPKVGIMMSVVFQRFPGDERENPSQIQSITCH